MLKAVLDLHRDVSQRFTLAERLPSSPFTDRFGGSRLEGAAGAVAYASVAAALRNSSTNAASGLSWVLWSR
jgi:hypothetical protein